MEIIFPQHKKDWKKFELKNKSIALNVLYIPYNAETIRHVYNWKYNKEHENQITLLIIIGDEKWNYLPVKKQPASLRGVTSKHDGEFYCLNCFDSCTKKTSLKSIIMFVKIMVIVV